MDCRAFGLVEHFGLDECFVYIFAHFSTERVQFADEMAFGTADYVAVAGHQGDANAASQPAWPAPTTMMSKDCSRFFMLFLLYFYFLSLFLLCDVCFAFLGRRHGVLALGSCGKPQRGRKATAPLHTPRAFF